MTNIDEPLSDLKHIRKMMERSTRFISLSGMAGIVVGFIALAGAGIARWRINEFTQQLSVANYRAIASFRDLYRLRNEMMVLAIITFVLALAVAYFFTQKKAKEEGISILDPASKRLLFNLFIPLISGAAFCLFLLHENVSLIAPAMLIFYGLSLVNAAKYTKEDILLLGLAEIVLGIISGFFPGKGIYFWSLGFGVFHILYGTYMHIKYER
jgi:hypothetical protein